MNGVPLGPLQLGLVSLLGVLAVATLVVAGLTRGNADRDYVELRLRVRTWWVIVAVFVAALAFDRRIGILILGVVSFLAFKEFLTLVPTRPTDYRVLIWAYLSIPTQYYWVGIGWYGMFIIFIPVYVFLFLPMRMATIGDTSGFLRAAGTLHWGLMTTVFSLSHIAFLLNLPDLEKGDGAVTGAMLVFFLVVATQLNDIAQYVWGRTIGKRKIVPRVSPGKTMAGIVGGAATTSVVASIIAPWFTPFDHWQGLVGGVMIGIAGFVGDVVMSAIKRDIGVKDSGSLLPGHGGILDRLDSLTFTAPLYFHAVYYLHY